MTNVYTFCEYQPMETMGDRLKAARERFFPSARKAALRHHWTYSTYAGHENGQNDFGPDEAKTYAKAFKTKGSWLLTGEGDPGFQIGTKLEPEQIPDDRPEGGIFEIDTKGGLGAGGTVDQTFQYEEGREIDPVKAEAWHFPTPFVRHELRRSEDRIRIIETIGDSMAPTIQSGDRVIIDMDHVVPTPDGLYAIRDRYGSIVVKRLQTLRRGDPPQVRIISDNKAHDAEDVGADEIAIVGRVLWGLKRL